MTVPLPAATADRLAKLCGMFSSAHDGERATAAAMADRIIRAAGLTWPELLAPRPARPTTFEPQGGPSAGSWRAVVAFCRTRQDILTGWEVHFLANLVGCRRPSTKQLAFLQNIVAKVIAE